MGAIELYRIKMCALKGWPEDSKMLILWDVYVRHRDTDLIEWMKNEFQNIIVLYIPANLTKMVQLLDSYLNAMMKTSLYTLRNE